MGPKGLNRAERKLYQRLFKGETVTINLLQQVEAFDGDGTLIKNKDGVCPPLKEIVEYALATAHQTDQNTGFKQKNERYLILKVVKASDEVDLTEAQIKLIKERIGMLFLQIEIVGRAAELLDGAVAPVAPGSED
jgi:hypothetical protein